MSDNFVSPGELLKHFQEGHYYEKVKVDDKYFEDLLRLYPTEVRKRMISNKSEIIAQYKSFEDIEIILNSQEPSSYFILSNLINDIEEVLKKNNIVLDKKIVFGTIPMTKVNAGKREFLDDTVLILIYDGLFMFFYFIAAVIASFLKKSGERNSSKEIFDLSNDSLEAKFTSNIFGHEKFVELLRCFKNRRFIISYDWYETDFNPNAAKALWDTAELFTVAHEYGHILLKHTLNNRSKMNEYEADYSAFRITIARNLNKNWGLAGAFWGIDFLFDCMQLIEMIDSSYLSDSHPTALERKLVLRSIFKELFPDEYNDTCELLEVSNNILIKLWNMHKYEIL